MVDRLMSPDEALKLLKTRVLEQAMRDAASLNHHNPHRRFSMDRDYSTSILIDEHIRLEEWLTYEEEGGHFNSKTLCEETGRDFSEFRAEMLATLRHSK
jgi:hypothetical protein